MSDNVLSAGNQQGSRRNIDMQYTVDPSETTRRSPLTNGKGEIIAYIQGAMHDASLNKKKRIRIVQKHKDWLIIIQKLLININVNSWIYKEGKDRDVYCLETVTKELKFSFNPDLLKDLNEKKFYLKGFFDAEGGIPRNGKRFYIQLTQKDLKKIKIIKNMLNSLGIESGKIHNPSRKIDPEYWRIFISTKSHYRFISEIGSYHPIKSKIFNQRMKI
ncbi:MAG: LAGLIDADG family homing endonuclease [Patescibacteria group bacterium]